ncbi:MAG: GntR family transcriptional regulator, partial [Pararhizobium sp.]
MDNIRNGMWLPEERVPSEARLVAALGVSKGSVERAVRELAREGVVTRIRGIGTFVATANVRRVRFVVRSLYRATRSCADVSVVFARESDACPAIASTLEIESGSRFFHSLLLHSTAGAPITLEEHFIDAAAAPNYLDQDFRTVRPG